MPEMKSLTLNGKTYDNFVDQTARSMSLGSGVIDSASGENITLTDASKYNLLELHIYGKPTQNGTPTPDAPVELESVGDNGSITVNVTGEKESQSMVVATPNGLPGIPTMKDGNYTDSNGQQWICDEIDLARGVYVKRIGLANLAGTAWVKNDSGKYFTTKNHGLYSNAHRVVCTHIKGGIPSDSNKENVIFINANNDIRLNITQDDDAVEAVQKTMNGAVLIGVLVEPIETPLSAEEIAAYAAIYTYRDHTAVTNDASAHMELEYVMDAKKYIQDLIAYGGSSPARLTSVTIRASAWQTTADNLHSQVVTIDGITSYSKVDLLPSVEQLAIFHNKDVAFVTENEDGVVTVYAIGDRPQLDYTMQAQITEVVV
jgi:hypothetical protein